jgi:hypothetical protein
VLDRRNFSSYYLQHKLTDEVGVGEALLAGEELEQLDDPRADG